MQSSEEDMMIIGRPLHSFASLCQCHTLAVVIFHCFYLGFWLLIAVIVAVSDTDKSFSWPFFVIAGWTLLCTIPICKARALYKYYMTNMQTQATIALLAKA